MGTHASNPRPAAPHWSQQEIRLLVELRRAGLTATEIGSRLGRTKDGVQRMVNKLRERDTLDQMTTAERRCADCGKRMARLNLSDRCYACLGSVA